jgi:hypothetical protein
MNFTCARRGLFLATACQRQAVAPANVHLTCKTTGRCDEVSDAMGSGEQRTGAEAVARLLCCARRSRVPSLQKENLTHKIYTREATLVECKVRLFNCLEQFGSGFFR